MRVFKTTFFVAFMVILNIVTTVNSLSANNCISLYEIEPLAEDIYFLELINRARANPSSEAMLYNIELNEGVNSSSTISEVPKQPLAFNIELYKAALAHSEDMLLQDYFSHYTYPTNDSPKDRTTLQGYYYYSGENIAINMSTGPLAIDQNTAAYHHELLFLDEDYPNRGHRVNMLTASHAEAGVAFAYGDYEQYPNAVVSTTDFGRGESDAYICGVIYDDKNGNNFYEPGEGIPYTTLTVVETGDSVNAFNAGAYSLGLSSPGTFTVEAYLCEYNIRTTKTVTIGSENIKLDFLLSDFKDYVKPPDSDNPPNGSECKSLAISEIISPQTSEEFANIPVKVAGGSMPSIPFPLPNGSFLNMDISLPCYTQVVDLYIALVFPDGKLYFLSDEGKLTASEFAPFTKSITEAKSGSFKFNYIPKGNYELYWAVVPSNSGDLLSVNWASYCELGYFNFSIY